jgi:hypothetical protein
MVRTGIVAMRRGKSEVTNASLGAENGVQSVPETVAPDDNVSYSV